jgi:hypothetical protein
METASKAKHKARSYVLVPPTGLPQVMPILSREETRWGIIKGLQLEYGGEIGTRVAGNVIDIFTDRELIVVSDWEEWKEAVRILEEAFAVYPYKLGWVHLFGIPPTDGEDIVNDIIEHGIIVTEDLSFSPPRSSPSPTSNGSLSTDFLAPPPRVVKSKGRHIKLR